MGQHQILDIRQYLYLPQCIRKDQDRVFPGVPVVKTLPSNAGGAGSIVVWGAKISYALWPKNQNIKQKQYFNKFKKDF